MHISIMTQEYKTSKQISKKTGSQEPLGIYTENVAALENQGFRGLTYERKKKIEAHVLVGDLKAKFSRVASCGHFPVVKKVADGVFKPGEIRLLRSKEHGKAHFGGLASCSSVWACPVCAAKIQARRGREIEKAVDAAREQGLCVTMVTLTHPHHKGQALSTLSERHQYALRKLSQSRFWKQVRQELGVIGSIKATEITYGENGWHWHTHFLLIHTNKNNLTNERLAEQWIGFCRKAGFEINNDTAKDMMRYSVDVIRDCHATTYLTKAGLGSWGVDREISSNASKHGRNGGKTPFELVDAGEYWLFREYLEATKGKRQLFWSRGLKKMFGITEKSDEELVEETEECSEVLAIIPPVSWSAIVRDWLQVELLAVAELGGRKAVLQWFQERGLEICLPDSGGGDGG